MRCVVLFLLFLLLSACAEPAPSGPAAIVLLTEVIDVGRVAAGTERRLVIPWRRAGAGPLRVLAVQTDCGCALAEGPRGPQAPGARGEVVVRLRGRASAGPFLHRVTVFTDQPPPRDVVRCRLRGWSHAPVALAPSVVQLGLRSPGVRLQRDAEVRLDPALATAALAARLEGLDGSVRLLPPVRLDVPGRLLRIVVTTPASNGHFEGRVVLEHDGQRLGTLPVRGEVAE